jgi:hypothetical protein
MNNYKDKSTHKSQQNKDQQRETKREQNHTHHQSRKASGVETQKKERRAWVRNERVYVLLKPQMQLSVRSPKTTNGADLHGGLLLKILKLKFVDFQKYLGIELYSLGCPMI